MIHDTAIIEDGVELGENVSIGPFTIVRSGTKIGANSVIEGWSEIGKPAYDPAFQTPLRIGSDSYVRSHSVFYSGSAFGEKLVTGHRVTVREDTQAGLNLQIGTQTDIQGQCTIGDYVRMHSHAQINNKSIIGDFVWLFPYVVLTNDPRPPSDTLSGVVIKNFVAIAAMSVILPGVTLEEGALIGANSTVTTDAPKNTVFAGSPAKLLGKTTDIKLKDGSGKPAYPWRRHFHRGYPLAVVEDWKAEFPMDR